ncbi:MAG: addiction module protein [Bacteroidetes bacterium RIFCSPLOWO2_02_FULL_36_8]|nr:MAG: addiction module protein [Bacteroidetes bacterium RIFCSPLOWO2_02_FULL_36_8]OFY71813.1 MAG: addiction module protein [Bacteroidetes bacterium RIFCSPLOWO2_12_FULL_37_12]
MKTKDLISEANFLPVEERALIVDSLLLSFNSTYTDIESEWSKVAKKRLSELRSGIIKSIPGEVVFDKIQRKFSK